MASSEHFHLLILKCCFAPSDWLAPETRNVSAMPQKHNLHQKLTLEKMLPTAKYWGNMQALWMLLKTFFLVLLNYITAITCSLALQAFIFCLVIKAYYNEKPSMRSSNFCEQFERRPNFTTTSENAKIIKHSESRNCHALSCEKMVECRARKFSLTFFYSHDLFCQTQRWIIQYKVFFFFHFSVLMY